MEISNHVGLVEVSVFVSYLQSGTGGGKEGGIESIFKADGSGKQLGGETDSLAESALKLTDTKTGLIGQFLYADGALVVEHVIDSPHDVGAELGITCERQQISFCDLDFLGESLGFGQLQPNFLNAFSQDVGTVELLIGERRERDAEKLPGRERSKEDTESKNVPGKGDKAGRTHQRAYIVNPWNQFQFAAAKDDAGASAKIEGYNVAERGDIGLLVSESRKSHFTRSKRLDEFSEFNTGL